VSTGETTPQVRTRGRGVPAALTRYRIMAYVVGVLLLLLIGTGHGFLYCVYLLAAFDLALRARWTAKGTVLVLLAGTIPFLTFVAEHIVTRKTRAGERV
jgi:hypothetical protein